MDPDVSEANPARVFRDPDAGGAKSPALLAENSRVRDFVCDVNRRGDGGEHLPRALLSVKSGIARRERITGFNDPGSYSDLCVAPHAIEAGAIWVDGEHLVCSSHPDFSAELGREMVRVLNLFYTVLMFLPDRRDS